MPPPPTTTMAVTTTTASSSSSPPPAAKRPRIAKPQAFGQHVDDSVIYTELYRLESYLSNDVKLPNDWKQWIATGCQQLFRALKKTTLFRSETQRSRTAYRIRVHFWVVLYQTKDGCASRSVDVMQPSPFSRQWLPNEKQLPIQFDIKLAVKTEHDKLFRRMLLQVPEEELLRIRDIVAAIYKATDNNDNN